MKTGGMRLHWDAPDGTHLYEDFPCLNDALDRAARVWGTDEGTLTRLVNWMAEDACPPAHLLAVAMLRWDAAADQGNRDAEHAAMEARPGYGIF